MTKNKSGVERKDLTVCLGSCKLRTTGWTKVHMYVQETYNINTFVAWLIQHAWDTSIGSSPSPHFCHAETDLECDCCLMTSLVGQLFPCCTAVWQQGGVLGIDAYLILDDAVMHRVSFPKWHMKLSVACYYRHLISGSRSHYTKLVWNWVLYMDRDC